MLICPIDNKMVHPFKKSKQKHIHTANLKVDLTTLSTRFRQYIGVALYGAAVAQWIALVAHGLRAVGLNLIRVIGGARKVN